MRKLMGKDLMYQTILDFPNQFSWDPRIINSDKFPKAERFVITGMGGSHIGADILKRAKPRLDLVVHQNYALPKLSPKNWEGRPVITVSYSGNTEETIDCFEKAVDAKRTVAAIATGGRLLELAKKVNTAYIKLPDKFLQPRMATGYILVSILKLTGETKLLAKAKTLSQKLKPKKERLKGQKLAFKLKEMIPIIYSSFRNQQIASNWKIKFNETAKIPAFYNLLPELSHNEIAGFSEAKKINKVCSIGISRACSIGISRACSIGIKKLCRKFFFIFLTDSSDHSRIQKRMKVLERLYKKSGLKVVRVKISGKEALEKVFSSTLLADWTAYYLAKLYGVDPEEVPMVEEFKKLIAK